MWSATAVFVRCLHTAMVTAVVSSFFFTDTSLRKTVEERNQLYYPVLYLLAVMFSLTMYWTACLADPGFVPISKNRVFEEFELDENGDLTLESSKMLKNGVKFRKCGYCGIVQPIRARHCEECERCVSKFDHHCPWLATCVGENNHKFFWWFLCSTAFAIVWSFAIVIRAFVFDSSNWWHENLIFLIDFIVLFASGFVTICLLCLHTHIMCINTTTWEMVSRQRITYLKELDRDVNPFHEGYCVNMVQFLCRLTARQWDRVYNRHVKVDDNKEYSQVALRLNRESGGARQTLRPAPQPSRTRRLSSSSMSSVSSV